MPRKKGNKEISINEKYLKLARRLFRYERFKRLDNCLFSIIQNEIELIAQAIDDIPEEIDCNLLKLAIENIIISNTLDYIGYSSCFNCKHHLQTIFKSQGGKDCPYINRFGDYININAHKICPQYILDEDEFNRVSSDIDNQISIMQKKYNIDTNKVRKIINYHVKNFLTELKEIPSYIDLRQNSEIWQ